MVINIIRNWTRRARTCFLKRMEEKYGKDYILHFGDWSIKDQINGCALSIGVFFEESVAKEV